MDRLGEIQAKARDIAERTHTDPIARNMLANDLIQLVILVVTAVGKSVAVDAESSGCDPDDESWHARYLVGEQMQESAQWVGAGLERYERDGLTSVWVPGHCAEALCTCPDPEYNGSADCPFHGVPAEPESQASAGAGPCPNSCCY
jgi:hypothetical protein